MLLPGFLLNSADFHVMFYFSLWLFLHLACVCLYDFMNMLLIQCNHDVLNSPSMSLLMSILVLNMNFYSEYSQLNMNLKLIATLVTLELDASLVLLSKFVFMLLHNSESKSTADHHLHKKILKNCVEKVWLVDLSWINWSKDCLETQ